MKRALILFPYCLFILIIIILADLGKLPLHFLYWIPQYDKAAHLILYGLLYGLLNYFMQEKTTSRFRVRLSFAFIITSALIITEEFSQLLFPYRTFSLIDLLMGFIGIGMVKIFSMHRRRQIVK